MEYEQLSISISQGFEKLLPVVKEAANQLFGREFDFEQNVSAEKDTKKLISGEEFPRVYIRFSTVGKTGYRHLLTIASEFVLKLYAWMIDAEPDKAVSDEHLEGVQEGLNQILGQVQTALDGEEGAFKTEDLKIELMESDAKAVAGLPEENGLGITYNISTGEESFAIRHYIWSEDENVAKDDKTKSESETNVAEEDELTFPEEDFTEPGSVSYDLQEEELVGVHPAEFDSLNGVEKGNGQPRNMEMLMDVELEVFVELGKKTMLVKDVLKLGKGSVVELDKAAGEPLEIYVNGRKLAEGEVVVVDDHFGIRITQLAEPKDRIKSLG